MMTNKPKAGRVNVCHVGHVVILFWARGCNPGRSGIPLNVGHVALFFLFDYMTDKMKLFSRGAEAGAEEEAAGGSARVKRAAASSVLAVVKLSNRRTIGEEVTCVSK